MAKAKSDLSKLQNGSDIRGIALTGIEGELPTFAPMRPSRSPVVIWSGCAKKPAKGRMN